MTYKSNPFPKTTKIYDNESYFSQAIVDLIYDRLSASNFYTLQCKREHDVDCVDVSALGKSCTYRIVVNGAIAHNMRLSDGSIVVFWDLSIARWWCNGWAYSTPDALIDDIEEHCGYWYDCYE